MGFSYQMLSDLIDGAYSRIYLTVSSRHREFWLQPEVQVILEMLVQKECDVKIRTDDRELLPETLRNDGLKIDYSYRPGIKAPVSIFDDNFLSLAIDPDPGTRPYYMYLKDVRGWVKRKLPKFNF